MNDLIRSQSKKLSIRDDNLPTIYNGALHHCCLLDFEINTYCIGQAYYFNYTRSDSNTITEIKLYHLETHELINTIHLPETTCTRLYPVYSVNQDSDKYILAGDTCIIVIQNIHSNPDITVYQNHGKYHFISGDRHIFWNNKVYLLSNYGVEKKQIHYTFGATLCYDLDSDVLTELHNNHTHQIRHCRYVHQNIEHKLIICYPYKDTKKAIRIYDAETNLPIFSIDQEAIASAKSSNYTRDDLENANTNSIIPLWFRYESDESIIFYDIHSKKGVYKLSIIELSKKLSEYFNVNRYTYNWLLNASFNPDKTCLALIIDSGLNIIYFLYDTRLNKIILSHIIHGLYGFPSHFENKMKHLCFSITAIESFKLTYASVILDSKQHLSDSKRIDYITQSKNKGLIYELENKKELIIFDTEKFKYKRFRLNRKSEDSLRIVSANGLKDCILCEKKIGKYFLSRELSNTVQFVAYNPFTREILDTLNMNHVKHDVVNQDSNCAYACPALNIEHKNKRRSLIVFGDDYRLKEIEENNTVAINNQYFIQYSQHYHKIYIYDWNHKPITSITIDTAKKGRLRETVEFSNHPDYINAYFYEKKMLKRFSLSGAISGSADPVLTVQFETGLRASYHKNYLESLNGRYISMLSSNQFDRSKKGTEYKLFLYDTDKQKEIYNNWLTLKKQEQELKLTYIDNHLRFLIIEFSGKDSMTKYYCNPYTMEIIGEYYMLKNEKFFFQPYIDGKQSQYFYTNAAEIVAVYQKDNGKTKLLQVNDVKRSEYLNIYNSYSKVRDIILNPEKFEQDETALINTLIATTEYKSICAEAVNLLK